MNQVALSYLEVAIKNNYSLAEIKKSPLFDSLKSDSKYQKLVKKSYTN